NDGAQVELERDGVHDGERASAADERQRAAEGGAVERERLNARIDGHRRDERVAAEPHANPEPQRPGRHVHLAPARIHEQKRWPREVVGKPVVTAARIDRSALSSLEIDEAVREAVRDGRSLYAVDAALIEELAPDLIVTQDLCAVCAVSSGELRSACADGVEV